MPAASKKAAPKKTAPNKAIIKHAAPVAKKAAPKKPVVKHTAPTAKKTAPKQATAKKPAAKKATVTQGMQISQKNETTSPFSFSANTEQRAKDALCKTHNAPHCEGIKQKAFAEYSDLKEKHNEQE